MEKPKDRLIESVHSLGGELWPIIHISAHGNPEGIALTDGTFVAWDELRDVLQPWNDALPAGLLITLSSCSGASGIRMAMFEEHGRPFAALVGHMGNALWADAAVAFTTFYHLIFKGVPIDEAVKAMRTASGDEAFVVYTGASTKSEWVEHMQRVRREEMAHLLQR